LDERKNHCKKKDNYKVIASYQKPTFSAELTFGKKPDNILMNAGFSLWIRNRMEPLSLVKLNGKNYYERIERVPFRPVLAWNKHKATILYEAELQDCIPWENALGGGPLLIPYSDEKNYPDDIVKRAAHRSMVGITREGIVKFIKTDPATLKECIKIGKKEKCISLMLFDGGKVSEGKEAASAYFTKN
jgi:hypothetical protein